MPPPLTIPHHGVAGNLRHHDHRQQHNYNVINKTCADGSFPPQQISRYGINALPHDLNPQLSTRFAGDGRQSAASCASGGVGVTEGKHGEGLNSLVS